jgi:ABC-type branched-subunit amino acid transport system permease subunit
MTALWRFVPLHAVRDLLVGSPLLVLALVLAGLGASLVVGLALAVFLRRRSDSYLLVTLAVATVLARVAVASLALNGTLDAEVHHLTEHGLDVAMVALVIAAVYTARQVERGRGGARE